MNSLLTELGPAWAFRVIGLITLGTGLPAAYLIKERTTIRPSAFIEWFVSSNVLMVNLFLTTPLGDYSAMFDLQFSSQPVLLQRSPSSSRRSSYHCTPTLSSCPLV